MAKYKIPVEIEVDDEWITDVMVTVAEGGISYWCPGITVLGNSGRYIDAAKKRAEQEANRDFPVCFSEICGATLLEGGELLLNEIEGDHKDNREKYTLTLEKLLKGVAIWAKARLNDAASLGELFSFDPGDIDAAAADCIVQFGLFGKLVYS